MSANTLSRPSLLFRIAFSAILLGASLAWPGAIPSALAQEARPIRALLITGGGWHDFEGQKKILTEGITARANVEWTIDHEAGTRSNVRIPRLEDPGFAKGFDVVVYSMCFSGITEVDFVHQICKAHEGGVPAVFIHCAMHSFRDAKTEEWRKLLGVTTVRHESPRALEVKNLNPGHPVMKGFPEVWKTPHGELYMIEATGPNTIPLAQAYGVDTRRDHPVIWVNTYNGARVFGTTLGHHNVTMEHPNYLDFAARGLLWTVDKLDENGKPKAGYTPRTPAAPPADGS